MKKRILIGMALVTVGMPGLARPALATEPMITLANHVPHQLQSAIKMAHIPGDEIVQLSLVVNVDTALLQQMLDQMYSPHASGARHFLSSSEFAQTFGLADKRQALKNFAQANGLTVDTADDQPESMLVKVSGGAGLIEKTFNVHLNNYRSAAGQMFRANDADPVVPASLAPHLRAILGLSNLQGLRHPHIRTRVLPPQFGIPSAPTVNPTILPQQFPGSGPLNGLSPGDIKTIYGLNAVGLTGSGQTAAVLEYDGYNPSDITLYQNLFGIAKAPVTFVGVDGISNLCGLTQNQTCNFATLNAEITAGYGGMQEVALDIEMIAALAPGASSILVYDGPNSDQGNLDILNKMAADNTAKTISISWGLDEQTTTKPFADLEASIFQRMAAQGQTVYAAAGDKGAYDAGGNTTLAVDDPASQPYVTGVGGTSLAGTVASYVETVWNNGFSSGRYDASGGGVSLSTFWPIPSYQKGIAGTVSQQFRNVPDVSLNADPNSGYAIVVGGVSFPEGGTSAAAPLWAGLTALINQQRVAAGKDVFGFANPSLYQLAVSTSATVFADITSGNNGFYAAAAGYDNATGWGSFKGSALIDSASNIAAATALAPALAIYAYPNPWDVRKNAQKKITFANLPANATVKIFTVSGFWIKTLTGQTPWDLTNDSGQEAASGLYLYLVNGDGISNVQGKIALIR